MTEKFILILLGGFIGILSSVVTIILKQLIENKKEKKKTKNEIQTDLIFNSKTQEKLPDHHPLHDLIRIRTNIQKELKAESNLDGLTLDKIRLFIELTDRVLNLSDRELKRLEKIADIENKKSNLNISERND